MIEIVMLVSAGFLAASLLALLLAPVLWRRAVRLTEIRVRSLTPLSMAEIQADKDRLRAEFALQIRQLENALEKLREDNAAKHFEIVRSSDLAKLRSAEALTNARTVSEMDGEIEALRQELIHAESEAKVNLKALKKAQRRLVEQGKELEQARAAAREASLLCDEQKVRIAALQTEVATGEEEIRGANAAARPPHEETQQMLADMAAKVRELTLRDGELARVNAEHDRLKGELGLAHAELSAQKLEIEALRQEKAARDRAAERAKGGADAPQGAGRGDGADGARVLSPLEQDRAENEALRERLAEIAAQVAQMSAALAGGDPVIKKILGKGTAAKRRRAGKPAPARGGTGAARRSKTPTTLADRIRALQAHISAQT